MVMDAVVMPEPKQRETKCLFVDVVYEEFQPDTYTGIVITESGEERGNVTKFGRDTTLSLQEALESNYQQLINYHRDHICDRVLLFTSSWDNFRMDSKLDYTFFDDDMMRRRLQNDHKQNEEG